jgi:hypothetical protein
MFDNFMYDSTFVTSPCIFVQVQCNSMIETKKYANKADHFTDECKRKA